MCRRGRRCARAEKGNRIEMTPHGIVALATHGRATKRSIPGPPSPRGIFEQASAVYDYITRARGRRRPGMAGPTEEAPFCATRPGPVLSARVRELPVEPALAGALGRDPVGGCGLASP